MDSNPYSAPQAVVFDGTSVRLAIEPASRWRRLLNLLIDYAGVVLVLGVFGILLGLIGGEEAIAWLERPNVGRDYALAVGAMFVYYVPLEGLFGATLGKLLTGTRVVDENGAPPSWGQAFGRTLCRLIPFEAFSMFAPSRRGWHDRVPRTYVVRRSR